MRIIKALENNLNIFNRNFVFFERHKEIKEIMDKHSIILKKASIMGYNDYYYIFDDKKFQFEEFKKDMIEKFKNKYDFEICEIKERLDRPLAINSNDLYQYTKDYGFNNEQSFTVEADVYDYRQSGEIVFFKLVFDNNKQLNVIANDCYIPLDKDNKKINLENKKVKVTGYVKLYDEKSKIQFSVCKKIEKLNDESEKIKKFNENLRRYKEKGWVRYNNNTRPQKDIELKHIGLIANKTSDSYKDFFYFLYSKHHSLIKLKDVILKEENIIQAIKELNKENDCQLIIIIRGGGSSYDLDEFSKESLVEAVATSKIDIVTGTGHTNDISLCDKVAFYNAGTPTNAAKYINSIFYQNDIKKKDKEIQELKDLIEKLNNTILDKGKELKNTILEKDKKIQELKNDLEREKSKGFLKRLFRI